MIMKYPKKTSQLSNCNFRMLPQPSSGRRSPMSPVRSKGGPISGHLKEQMDKARANPSNQPCKNR